MLTSKYGETEGTGRRFRAFSSDFEIRTAVEILRRGSHLSMYFKIRVYIDAGRLGQCFTC